MNRLMGKKAKGHVEEILPRHLNPTKLLPKQKGWMATLVAG